MQINISGTVTTSRRRSKNLLPEHGLDRLPELEPAEDRLRNARGAIFESDALEFGTNKPVEERADKLSFGIEAENLTARATVYTMNAILCVMAFPVGAALLTFNILGGENIRTTAHAIALTGMGIGLSMTEVGATFF